jgi:hypothetical protein
MRKHEWWTLFWYGSVETICSKHRSAAGALRAAAACERRGGADHRIVEIVEAIPYRSPSASARAAIKAAEAKEG